MPYKFKRSESVPEGIKRIVTEEIDSAVHELARGKNRDEAVHEARKSLKKIRGALRLVQPELGRTYREENAQLGDIGRKLSEIRDATAIIEVFDGLLDRFRGDVHRSALTSIRRALERSKRETEQALDVGNVIKQAAATLRSARKRVGKWPLENDGFKAISGGLEERYRRGRKAMAAARKDPKPENYHEWRKRAKDHWYHVRLIEPVWTDILEAREKSLKDLETWLGDDHNFVVLNERIKNEPEKFGDEKQLTFFCALVSEHQNELRQNSMALGERIYEEKPRHFTASLSKLWDAWQSDPESLKKPPAASASKKKTAAA